MKVAATLKTKIPQGDYFQIQRHPEVNSVKKKIRDRLYMVLRAICSGFAMYVKTFNFYTWQKAKIFFRGITNRQAYTQL
jgi:hypothetical protein